jgi:ectoine hydroxylase-related dioxygenase (phytanoyl-CoA dioxygenase family)
MPWTILEKLWNRSVNVSNNVEENDTQTWDNEVKTLYQLGIGMEDTLQFLYFEKPDFETFKNWISQRQKKENSESEDLTENVLSKEDLQFWAKNGYVVVKNVISKKECQETEMAVWEFLQMNPDQKETWYKGHDDLRGLMLNFSDHTTLNKNRLSLKIKKAYEQLYNTTHIYKTIDKVSFNPPETEDFTFLGSALHWDTSLKKPIAFALQGLLYLTDCTIEDGAFHCVPGFHNEISSWLDNLSPDENPRAKALETLKPEAIIGNAGDFIIWDNRLPHCASANKGRKPRIVQYLTYLPNDFNTTGEWI